MSTTDIEKPYLNVTVTKDTKARSLSDEITEILNTLFTNDVDDALALAKSPDKEDSPSGNPNHDRVLLASAVKKLATDAHPQVQAVKIDRIVPLVNRCSKRIGVDRVAIAAKKAEFLAILAAEPVGKPWDEPILNSTHDSLSTDEPSAE